MTGRIAALSHFISRLTNRCKPFFRALKSKQTDFWGPEQSEVLMNLKQYLSSQNFLGIIHEGEPLFLYLAILEVAASDVLFKEENQQHARIKPYISLVAFCSTQRLGIRHLRNNTCPCQAKLRQYFEGHEIMLNTNLPIRVILSKPISSRRMTKWAIELSEFEIKYVPRTAQKGKCSLIS